MRTAVAKGRAVRPNIKLGICGEHGGDPASVHFCHEVGLDYVSCSPYRVPLARLAAAHAALGAGGPGLDGLTQAGASGGGVRPHLVAKLPRTEP